MKCHDKEIEVAPNKKLKNIGEVLAASKFKHGPIREGDCLPCHNAHATVNYRLLKEVFPEEFYKGFDVKNYTLCFTCHQKTLVLDEKTTTLTGFRDGNVNLHFVHVNKEIKGRTCRACHEIHASNLPKHIRRSVPFGSGGWLLPINFEKSENGGTCSPGCHKTLGYDRTKGGAPP
jgi:predicted CXXCH cytochrome family protein